MKHLYSFTAALLIAGSVNAQLGVLNSNEMPPIGTTFTYRTVSNLAVIDTTPGTNVTWDMSDILPTAQAPWDVDVMAPASSPHPTTFPTSNYCTFESEIPRYNYYDLNSAAQERVGSWATQQSTYTDGQIELMFPLEYGDSYTDTWDNTISSFGGTFSLSCIGTGTLVLPTGTHADVLLTRIVVYELFDIVMYQWISAANGAQVLLYYPGDDIWVPEGAAYVLNVNIGIEEAHEPLEMRIQSLVNDQLHVTYASNATLDYSILDASGQLLRDGQLPASPSPSTAALDVAGLPAGLYLVDLRDTGSNVRHAGRFVKP